MITSISKLKSFGIFQDYKPSKDLKPFVQYNVFYGWNGSGKSTLAKVFLSLTDKKTHVDFPDGEFSIVVKDCPDITHKNISQNTSNIKVFNRDFIDRNVNFEQSQANSILILSEEKKDDMVKYKASLADIMTKEGIYQSEQAAVTKAEEDLKKNLSKWASSIKKSFELIETSNSHYLNYDRTKLNTFIRTQKSNISKEAILSPEQVKELKSSVKPNQKADITDLLNSNLDAVNMLKQVKEIEKLLSKSIFSQQIERLIKNPEINRWVKEGIDIHVKYESSNCEFCGQMLQPNRLEEINKHFSKEYDELTGKLSSEEQTISQLISALNILLPDTNVFYDEFHDQYDTAKKNLIILKETCSSKLEGIKSKIEEKKKNPFDIIVHEFVEVDKSINDYNGGLKVISDLIKKHNSKNQSFDEVVKKNQTRLELHFASDLLQAENYALIEKDITDKRALVEIKQKELQQLHEEVQKLEAILLNEAVGAEEFNKKLEKFLGRKDISLEFDKNLKGYKLMRRGRTQAAKNLSEGEKTAIAFVYFISKLKEGGNQIEDTIVVLDDPISSFDSNHLFHSYSYLKQECEKAQQLFILTHNFQYFKLIRDWLLNKNTRKKNPDGTYEEKIRTNFYSIDCTIEEDRKAMINNANKTLLDYNSEYHYIFHKLLSLRGMQTLDLEKAFLIANLSRKLLESFLTFKFPRGRHDFNQLLQAGCLDSEIREKVYRFINKYSHNQIIDFNDGPIDNLLGEGNNIVSAVLKIVEDSDKAHYDEMAEVCAS